MIDMLTIHVDVPTGSSSYCNVEAESGQDDAAADKSTTRGLEMERTGPHGWRAVINPVSSRRKNG